MKKIKITEKDLLFNIEEMGGNGISGNGISGNGLSGNGLSGNGLSGNGLNGNGLSGDGLLGNGIDSILNEIMLTSEDIEELTK